MRKGGLTMDEYNNNPDFKLYVDKYCCKAGITPTEAVQHIIVKNVETEYRHKRLEGREKQ
jgi:hypothetical protein